MIGKLVKGKGASGLCSYLLGPKDHNGDVRSRVEVIGGTLAGQTAGELTHELAQLHDLRPNLGVHVAHQSLRVRADERLISDDEWCAIGTKWAEGMGFQGYAIVSHGDHIHLACSRVKLDGSTVSDAHDWKRSEQIIRDIEREFSLQQLESSHLLEPEKADTHRKALTMPQIALAERGIESAGQVIANLIEARLANGPVTVTDFVDALEQSGISVIPNLASTGKLSGFAYELNNERITASTLGRGFTFGNLVKRGLNYEPDRDRENLERLRSDRPDRILGRPIRTLARNAGGNFDVLGIPDTSESGNSRGVGDSTDAGGGSYGPAHRGNAANVDAHSEPEPARPQSSAGSSTSIFESGTGSGAGFELIDAQSRAPGDSASGSNPGDKQAETNESLVSGSDSISDPDDRNALARMENRNSENVGGSDARFEIEGRRQDSYGSDDIRPNDEHEADGSRNLRTADGASGRRTGSDGSAADSVTGDSGRPSGDLETAGRHRAQSRFNLARLRAAMMRQEPARAALSAAVSKSQAQRAPEAGPAVKRLQAIAGVVPTGDRTLDQVRSQLRAFGCDAFEVQPIPPKGIDLARERIRKWTAAQIEKSLGWLKRMNAQGYDIFIRPAAPTDETAQPFAFVDDVDQATVNLMAADGFPFAVLNESSTARFHGWIKLDEKPLDRVEISRAGRMLAERYGADINSADWRHYGRLAGTTNRKPSRATAKGAPFVMLRAASTTTAPGSTMLMAEVRQSLENDAKTAARAASEAYREAKSIRGPGRLEDPVAAFQEARRAAKPARLDDESARDFSGALSLLRRGYSQAEVENAIKQASPNLEDRHARVDDYVNRTVENAAARIAETGGYRP